jgi:hypothetical protein
MPAAVQFAAVFGMQPSLPPQTLGVPPPPQTWGEVQLPHVMRPPQPSASGPHEFAGKSVHVFGVHVLPPWPHFAGVPPPPQVSGALHVPHWISFPHPSPAGPHSIPWAAQLREHAPNTCGPVPPSSTGGMSDPDEPELPPSAAPSPKTLSSVEPQATMIAARKSPLAQACMRIDRSFTLSTLSRSSEPDPTRPGGRIFDYPHGKSIDQEAWG